MVLLFGPTGVGKTDLLLKLPAAEFEIISADSMQVYRGMDIGTAKPGRAERERLPHHLIDILTPDKQFHLGEFLQRADAAAAEIRDRGRVPVISGGTAYYFKHYLYGLPPAPASDARVRERLAAEAQAAGLDQLYRRLREVDPQSAARIAPADRYRILRALEVWESSGRPLSTFTLPTSPRPGIRPLILGLERPRSELYRRIDERVRLMIAAGLQGEVERLVREGYVPEDPGLRAIGYREFLTAPAESSLEDITAAVQRNSRRYAKRQLTFFRRIPGTRWFPADAVDEILAAIYSFLRS